MSAGGSDMPICTHVTGLKPDAVTIYPPLSAHKTKWRDPHMKQIATGPPSYDKKLGPT